MSTAFSLAQSIRMFFVNETLRSLTQARLSSRSKKLLTSVYGRRRFATHFAGWFALYATISLALYWLGAASWDLGIFAQALSNLSHGRAPEVPIKGAGALIFGDHWHPLILVAVPLFWLWDDAGVLLLAQAAALALTVVILEGAAERLQPSSAARRGLRLGASVAVMAAVCFDFHEVSLGAPLVALACRYVLQDRTRLACMAMMAALLAKEDMGLIGVGLAVAIYRKGHKGRALLLAGTCIAWTFLAAKVFIPWANTDGVNTYDHYNTPEATLVQIGGTLPRSLVCPGFASLTLALVIIQSGWACLRSPMMWASLLPWFARACVNNVRYWLPFYHYPLLVGIVTAFASLEGELALTRTGHPHRIRPRLTVALALAGFLGGPATLTLVPAAATTGGNSSRAMHMIPYGGAVAADCHLIPRLVTTRRVNILEPRADAQQWAHSPSAVDFAVLDRRTNCLHGPGWVPSTDAALAAAGFRQIYDDGRYVVRQRG